MENKHMASAHANMLAATLFIGSAVVVGKWTVGTLPVFLSQAAALIAALLVLVPLALRKYKTAFRIGRRDLLLLLLQALLGMFLYRAFMLYGLKHAAAADSAVVTSLTPAAVTLMSWLLLKERLTSRLAAGVLCSLLGGMTIQVMPLLRAGAAESEQSSVFGLLLVLAAVVGEAALTVIRKLQSDRVPPLLGTTYVCLFALAMFLVPSFFELSRFDLSGIGPREIGAVLYYGWFVTAAAYLFYFRGISILSSGMVAAYTAFVPASALLLASLLLGEPITLSLFAGLALVVAGMLLIAGPGRRREKGGAEAAVRQAVPGDSMTEPV